SSRTAAGQRLPNEPRPRGRHSEKSRSDWREGRPFDCNKVGSSAKPNINALLLRSSSGAFSGCDYSMVGRGGPCAAGREQRSEGWSIRRHGDPPSQTRAPVLVLDLRERRSIFAGGRRFPFLRQEPRQKRANHLAPEG